MQFVVQPSALHDAIVTVPGDKSVSHRALMLGSIADGITEISGFLAGEDCLATLAAMQAMGVQIDQHSATHIAVNGAGLHGLEAPGQEVDLGNSGTAMRLMTGLLAGQQFDSTLTGDTSLASRPMNRIITPLSKMGATIESNEGRPPLTIRGGATLRAISYDLPVASAQVKSAVLLAGLYAKGKTRVKEPAVTRDHTERMLATMGVKVKRKKGGRIQLKGGQLLRGTRIQVPADLSSAAFVVLAALVSDDAEVLIRNVGVNPTRTGLIDILQSMGANITLENGRLMGDEPVADIRVKSSQLRGGPVDPQLVSLAIDEFPVLFVAAALAKGTTIFSGLAELRVKESDRIAAMASGLQNLGIEVQETEDGAVVHGGRIRGGWVESFGDHRVAMSLAIAGTRADGPVTVRHVAAVDTSFPGFCEVMRQLGMQIDAKACEPMVIAIDGPSGSGKGTIARRVAEKLGYHLLDSGALYRLVALAALKASISLENEAELANIALNLDVEFGVDGAGGESILLNGEEVAAQIRTEEAGAGASAVAALPAVRAALLERQRAFCQAPGLVADGRDMGTQVFPDAAIKIFLTASAEERAQRRHKQLKDKGMDVSLAALSRDIEDRDRRDSERSVAPLMPAEDARILDSSGVAVDAVTQMVLDWVAELCV